MLGLLTLVCRVRCCIDCCVVVSGPLPLVSDGMVLVYFCDLCQVCCSSSLGLRTYQPQGRTGVVMLCAVTNHLLTPWMYVGLQTDSSRACRLRRAFTIRWLQGRPHSCFDHCLNFTCSSIQRTPWAMDN